MPHCSAIYVYPLLQCLQASDLEKQLWSVAESGDTDTVRQLIEDHVDIDSKTVVCVFCWIGWWCHCNFYYTQDGEGAIHLAAARGHTNVVELLIRTQANLNLQDKVLYMWKVASEPFFFLHFPTLSPPPDEPLVYMHSENCSSCPLYLCLAGCLLSLFWPILH